MTTIHIVDRYNAAPWSAPWSEGDIDALLVTFLHELETRRGNNRLRPVTETIEPWHQLYFQPYFVPDGEDDEFEPILQLQPNFVGAVDLELLLEEAAELPDQAIIVHLVTPNGAQFFWNWLSEQSSKAISAFRFIHWHCLPDRHSLSMQEAFLLKLPNDRKNLLTQLPTVLVHTEAECNELYTAPYRLAVPMPDFDHWQHTLWSNLRNELTHKTAANRTFRQQLRRQIGLVDQTIVAMERLDIWAAVKSSKVA